MPEGATIIHVPNADAKTLERIAPAYCTTLIARVRWAIAEADASVHASNVVADVCGGAIPEPPQNAPTSPSTS